MESTFLQDILKTDLFDIGDSDERLGYLEKSIAELQQNLSKDSTLLPKYTLVAFDPNIPEDEPILETVEKVVTTHWRALRSKYAEMPRNIHRGVILNALYNLGVKDAIASRIIYLTGSNFFPYAKLSREKKIIERLLFDLGEIAEKDAVEEWSFVEDNPSLKLGTLKVSGLKFNQVTIDGSKYRDKFRDGAGVIKTHNWAPQQNWDMWMNQISDGASDGIVELLKTTFDQFSKSVDISSIETSINQFFKDFKKSLDENLELAFSSLTAVERRSKLLWWKETLYSQSLHKSYRDIKESILPAIMSYDLYEQLPEITPISVDFLLKDSLQLIVKPGNKLSFDKFLESVSEEDEKTLLGNFFDSPTDELGRISLTDFICLIINGRVNIKDFKKRTGISGKDEITLGDLSIAILHDLLAKRLTQD